MSYRIPASKNDQVVYPDFCYVIIAENPPGERIGIVRARQKGITVVKGADNLTALHSTAEVAELVKKLNDDLNISPHVARAMRVGSWAGWGVPGAHPDNWVKFEKAEQRENDRKLVSARTRL